jgi:hypothetical protein
VRTSIIRNDRDVAALSNLSQPQATAALVNPFQLYKSTSAQQSPGSNRQLDKTWGQRQPFTQTVPLEYWVCASFLYRQPDATIWSSIVHLCDSNFQCKLRNPLLRKAFDRRLFLLPTAQPPNRVLTKLRVT